jgi:ABC-type dipeptide/oligopeptide/nickel transport system permease component
VVQRLLRIIMVWIGITLVTFFLLRLTGNPARIVLGEFTSDAAIQDFNHKNGLDRPLIIQYFSYMENVMRGDLGRSWRYESPILPIIAERVPATMELALASLVFSSVIGVLLGVLAAVKSNTPFDYISRGIVIFAQGVPNFFLALLLILLFGVALHWLPTGGRGGVKNLILPTVVLGLYLMPLTLRTTRSSVLDILKQDYIRTARGKGVRENSVVWQHVFRNAAIPIVTILGIQMATLFSGAIVTETVFSWPGIGRLLIDGVTGRDFPVVQGIVLIIATLVVVTNLLVDILYNVIDPRIRAG